MHPGPNRHLFLAFVIVLVAGVSGVAQQPRAFTAADYARAEKFMGYNTTSLVLHSGVRPTWLEGERFWYRNTTEGGSEFAFGVRSLTRYFTGLLADQKRLLPVPAYANFPTNPLRSGEDVALWLDDCPAIDFVAPDYYGFSPADLAFTMRHFAVGRNLPFVAEHSTESTGDADLNLFLAILEHGAAGFDPWAIDHAFGWLHWRDHVFERPFVTRDGSWTDAATAFGRVQSSLLAVANPLADALGGDGVMHYTAAAGIPRKMEERRWGLHWTVLSGPASRWVAVRTGDGDATIAGVDAEVTVGPLAPGVSLAASEGR